jgi:hypothetical protein
LLILIERRGEERRGEQRHHSCANSNEVLYVYPPAESSIGGKSENNPGYEKIVLEQM